MIRSVGALLLVLTLAACGANGAKTSVKIGPQDEAVVTFFGKTLTVTITNEGPSPVEVLWPTRMIDITLPPGTDSGQTLSGDSPIRITCKAPEGATVKLGSPGASGVKMQMTTVPPKK